MDELTKEFVAESREGLDRMELCLTDLESAPATWTWCGDIPRGHTIKGTTGFLGFRPAGEARAHRRKPAGGPVRGKIAATSNLISGLLELMDGLKIDPRPIEPRVRRLAPATTTRDSSRSWLRLKAGTAPPRTATTRPARLLHPMTRPTQPCASPRSRPEPPLRPPARHLDSLNPGASPGAGCVTQDRTLRIDVES